jgi:uncharacterized protein
MPPESPEPHSWLDPTVDALPSAIHGIGLFAVDDIPAGTVVSRLGGRLVSDSQLDALMREASAGIAGRYVDSIVVGVDLHLVLPVGDRNHYGNHSCDPNLWWIGTYTLAARRSIHAGEELTDDYATGTGSEGWAMPCSCASSLCRGVVAGSDWRRQDLRQRYGDHWVPALLDRIDPDRRSMSDYDLSGGAS